MNELSDQVRAIIFVLLVLVVFFAWSHFFRPPAPPEKQNQPAVQTAPEKPGETESMAAKARTVGRASAQAMNIPVAQASAEKTVEVESSLYSVELSNHGGVVRSWKLKKYFDDQKQPHPLDPAGHGPDQLDDRPGCAPGTRYPIGGGAIETPRRQVLGHEDHLADGVT